MTVRELQDSDIPTLNAMAEASGFPYIVPRGTLVERVLVVADENDQPLAAVAAERILQLYLWLGEMPPHAKLRVIRLLHEAMAPELKANGYTEVQAFLPPAVSGKFGRRLERTFGWMKNWQSWYLKF